MKTCVSKSFSTRVKVLPSKPWSYRGLSSWYQETSACVPATLVSSFHSIILHHLIVAIKRAPRLQLTALNFVGIGFTIRRERSRQYSSPKWFRFPSACRGVNIRTDDTLFQFQRMFTSYFTAPVTVRMNTCSPTRQPLSAEFFTLDTSSVESSEQCQNIRVLILLL